VTVCGDSPVTRVQITEVGMRDGFQMEPRALSLEQKVQVGRRLIAAGIKRLEATSFVSPSAVPQLADAAELIGSLKGEGAVLAALVPNRRGAIRAAQAGVDEMICFVSASEAHNRANINRPIEHSLGTLTEIADIADHAGIPLCGSVATSFGCPFEGDVSPAAVLRVLRAFHSVGIRDVSLGDTTGMATPPIVEALCIAIAETLPDLRVALHFHNTRGLGLVNVRTGLDLGITRFESSIGGLGGCPFAVGTTGNVCSEDLVYMLNELGIESGIDLGALIDVARLVEEMFGRALPGQVMRAGPRLKPAAKPMN
jgi:hydroxymethylglutaryl-CoA lyase